MGTDFFILMKPELGLMLILFLVLILKVADVKNQGLIIHLVNGLLLVNFAAGFLFNGTGSLFSGMYHTNPAIALEKNILNLGLLVVCLQSNNWLKGHRHMPEFYMLLISTVLGMFYMISAGNFLMFYMGLELSAIPLAALVNFDLEKKKSAEAAFKMLLSSAFASGIMLFGISLLYGATGTVDFARLTGLIDGSPLQLLALLFIFTGFAFKLSAVPFHFWTADVYEGAPVAVTSFLSVLSKAAIVFVFISVLAPLFTALPEVWYSLLLISIVLTISVGNLFAMRQNNIKRFLAFSSISQVGFILLGLSSANNEGTGATVYFLIVYLFSNLGAFGVISLVSAQTGREDISDYKGFYRSNQGLAWVLAISLFSLAGIPPTAGFFGKMFLITSGANSGNYLLIAFAALNMVISLYYYLRLVRAIFVDEAASEFPPIRTNLTSGSGLAVCLAGTVIIGFAGATYQYILNAFNLQ